jgi:hydroxymethylbilane synthase
LSAPAVLRIATRRSALARAQAHQTGMAIQQRTGRPFELVPLATTGDLEPERAVGDFDTKGLFVDTIRAAVLSGECHLAIHSYKDLPSEPVDGLLVAAVPQREDPRDILVSRDGHALATLPDLATVATSSERRRLQLLRTKPALQVLPVRGNVDTRLRKVADGEFDAAVIAFAGLRRLYTPPEHGGVGPFTLPLKAAPLEPGECLSAPAQGALGIECRADDEDTLAVLRAIDHQPSHRTVRAERAFLEALGGGCLTPIGALATVLPADRIDLIGMLGDPVNRRMLRRSFQGPYADPERLGRDLAADVLAAGGQDLLTAIAARRGGRP